MRSFTFSRSNINFVQYFIVLYCIVLYCVVLQYQRYRSIGIVLHTKRPVLFTLTGERGPTLLHPFSTCNSKESFQTKIPILHTTGIGIAPLRRFFRYHRQSAVDRMAADAMFRILHRLHHFWIDLYYIHQKRTVVRMNGQNHCYDLVVNMSVHSHHTPFLVNIAQVNPEMVQKRCGLYHKSIHHSQE